MLTAEERERRAYIEGNTELAAVLSGTADGHAASIAKLEHARDMLKDEIEGFEEEVEDLNEKINRLTASLS